MKTTLLAAVASIALATAARADVFNFAYPTLPYDTTNGATYLKITGKGTVFGLAVDTNYTQTYFTTTAGALPAGPNYSGANNDGTVSGTTYDSSFNPTGFTLSGGTQTPLTVSGTTGTIATGITDNGTVYGIGVLPTTTPGYTGFLQTASGTTMIADPNADNYTAVYGANNQGQAVGLYKDTQGNLISYLADNGVYTDIAVPGSTGTTAEGINDQGQIVGIYSVGNAVYGFIRQPDGSYTTVVNPNAVNGTYLFDINNASTIVGAYSDANYINHAFSLTVQAPEPASLALLATGLAALAARRRLRTGGSDRPI